MDEKKEFLYNLKSINNTYLISFKIIDEEKFQKIEIKLTHKSPPENLIFLLRNTRNELIRGNKCLSKYNSIKEIFNYFIGLLKPYQVKIIKCPADYYIILFDNKNDIKIKIQMSKMNDDYSEIETKIKDQKKIEESENELEKSNQGVLNGNISNKKEEDLKIDNSFNTKIIKNEKIISDEKYICNCFTVFINNKGMNIIFWSIKGKKILYLYNCNKDYKYSQHTHSQELNIIKYLQDNTEKKDFIITSSPMDEEILKIWELEEEKEVKLILKRKFQNNFFNTKIDLFCNFKCDKYNKNTFFIVYGKSLNNKKLNPDDVNANINRYISCYQLDKNFNTINWEFFDFKQKKYWKIINNYFQINYLDIYYDSKNNELYIINCNDNNVELITQPDGFYRGMNFKYHIWSSYTCAFIKESKGKLKLFSSCDYGIVIWDVSNNIKQEKFKECNDIKPPLYIIPLNNDSFFISGKNKFLIMDENMKIKFTKNKSEGDSRIKKFNSSEKSDFILIIDNNQLKCLEF